MVLSHEEERVHPYWYARVVEIFHVMVQSRKNAYLLFSAPLRMDILLTFYYVDSLITLSTIE